MKAVLVRYQYTDLELRTRHRDEHVARLSRLAEDGIVVLAGPERDAAGAVIVFAVGEEAAAQALMDVDPYVVHGAITSYSLDAFDAVVTSPLLSSGD